MIGKAGPYLELRPGASEAGESVESREARLATLSLADQNVSLRQDLGVLKKQVRYLSEALAVVRIEADLYKARLDQSGLEAEWQPAGDLDGELRIREVNPELRMVILDGGARRGLRNGMPLVVVREGKPVARLIVVDVRAAVAGAVIEETRIRKEPAAGDRVIPAPPGRTLR
ncbi:MAG: hypothetical protein KJ726_07080 [Verrucomicrobia bacterium]|nr:hypothetical protein [Verrucomicrobiota bacterium]